MKTEPGTPGEDLVEPVERPIEAAKPAAESGALAAILFAIVSILTVLAVVLTTVRIFLSPAFIQFEYRTPNFPPDPYGFTRADRLFWSEISREYLLNNAGIDFLSSLRFSDGTPVYNERELRHMVDVKNVVQSMLKVWYVSLAGLLVLAMWAWFGGWWRTFRRGLARGGWLTVVLVGLIIFFVLISFGAFFVGFHEVFFSPGTWIFYYSDTLIRLFPERFWRDAFLTVGILSVFGGLALALLFRTERNARA